MSVREPTVNVRFYKEDVVHGIQSHQLGREVTIQKDFVEIHIAGEKDKNVFPANREMQARFPEEWANYLKGCGPDQTGTPVRRWPQLSQKRVQALEQSGIYTVEALADLSDSALGSIGMGARELREEARKFLVLSLTAADAARLETLEAENGTLKAQLTELTGQMAEILKRLPKEKAGKKTEPAEA